MKIIPFIAILLITACNENPKTNDVGSATDSTSVNTIFKPANIQEKIKYSRAVESIIWSMPIVNFAAMYEATNRDVKGEYNQIVFWSKPLNWKNQTLTPNTEAIYYAFFQHTESRSNGA